MEDKSSIIWFFLLLVVIAIITLFGPLERSLGANVRVVYLHGAWVWSALLAIMVSGIVGFAGFLIKRPVFHRWSRAIGRTGLFFWITYLPISLWAMQTNWNGLYLAEPRWRLAIVFAVGGVLLQTGVTLLEDPTWASGANLLFSIGLIFALSNAEQVMHPPSPILNSDAWRIQIFFGGLTFLSLLAAWQMARWWRRFEDA